jgi:hypothetical protein
MKPSGFHEFIHVRHCFSPFLLDANAHRGFLPSGFGERPPNRRPFLLYHPRSHKVKAIGDMRDRSKVKGGGRNGLGFPLPWETLDRPHQDMISQAMALRDGFSKTPQIGIKTFK